MNILIDTHIFIWLTNGDNKLKQKHRELLATRENTVFFSSFSAAEIMIKSNLGKLNFTNDIKWAAQQMEIELLNLEVSDISSLRTMPHHHNDPFDRMLISQSINRGFGILTYDKKFSLYDCELIKG